MGNGCAVFNCLDVQASRLQCRDGTFAPAAWAFNPNINFFHPEFDCLFRGLLGCHLTGKRGALATSFEVAGSGARPTERLALGIGNGNRCIVKCRIDVCHAMRDISTYSLFL